jgi:hypothetical protein
MDEINGCAKPKTPKDTANEVTPATTKVPSSSAATEDSSVHLECCPEGSKVAKKRKNNDFLISNLIQGQKDLLKISRKKQLSFQSFTNNIVMSKDLSKMDDKTQDYFMAKQKLVIKQLKAK